jgi:ribosomal protein L24
MVKAAHKFKLRKEDTVEITTGKDKGKRGVYSKLSGTRIG